MHLSHQPIAHRNRTNGNKYLIQINPLKGVHDPATVESFELTFNCPPGTNNLDSLNAAELKGNLKRIGQYQQAFIRPLFDFPCQVSGGG